MNDLRGLKGVLPKVGNILGMTVDALYERQRELVRHGLLPAPTRRGPGGAGAKATPQHASILLLSILATNRLRDVGTSTIQLRLDQPGLQDDLVSMLTNPEIIEACGVTAKQPTRSAVQVYTTINGRALIDISNLLICQPAEEYAA